MKKIDLEFKVGLFVVVALLALGVLVYKTGDFYMKPGYTVRFLFHSISGIDKGSPVRLAGVNVGQVTAINILRDSKGSSQVEVLARINQGAYVEDDSDVRINSQGLLGEKYVEILPGTSGHNTLSEGGTLMGSAPVAIDKLTESGTRLVGKIEYTVDNLNQVVGDPEFKTAVKSTFTNASNTFGHAGIIAKNLEETTVDMKEAAKSARIVLGRLRDGEGTVGHLLKDDSIAKDLDAFVKDIKEHPWRLLKRD